MDASFSLIATMVRKSTAIHVSDWTKDLFSTVNEDFISQFPLSFLTDTINNLHIVILVQSGFFCESCCSYIQIEILLITI